MIIERTEGEIVIKLAPTINDENLQALADYARYLELTSRSKVSQEQIDELTKEVKKGMWERTKSELNL